MILTESSNDQGHDIDTAELNDLEAKGYQLDAVFSDGSIATCNAVDVVDIVRNGGKIHVVDNFGRVVGTILDN